MNSAGGLKSIEFGKFHRGGADILRRPRKNTLYHNDLPDGTPAQPRILAWLGQRSRKQRKKQRTVDDRFVNSFDFSVSLKDIFPKNLKKGVSGAQLEFV